MSPIHILITIPEYEGQQEFFDEIKGLSDRIRIHYHNAADDMEVADRLAGIDILYTVRMPPNLEQADRLKWVQMHTTGIDKKVGSPIFDSGNGIVVTNVAGAQAVSIAEYCMAAMTMLCRNFLQMFRDKQTRTWDQSHERPSELHGHTVLILGYGHIGREAARLATASHMRILVIKNNPADRQAGGYQYAGVGDPQGVLPERIEGMERLHDLLAESDFVVNCLPLTATTKELLGREAFAVMKDSAYFVNVGRGGTVDETALAQALAGKQIAGAALDVLSTDPNPPAPDNPLWELDNVFISPHIAGTRHNRQYLVRTTELFCENLRRYLAGQPLVNVVEAQKGY